jgi:hypothetical protein
MAILPHAKTIEDLRAASRAQLRTLADALDDWPGRPFSSHRSASLLYHALEFLADLGVKETDPDFTNLPAVLDKVRSFADPDGPLCIHMAIPKAYGGTGEPAGAWALCDAPILVYCAAAMGRADDPRVRKAVDFLRGLVRDNGWPCVVSKQLGNWRGPGRKDDPCPYATLAMLKALSAFDDLRGSPEAETGARCLLDLWETSRERHPYMFFMGTDFRKLKLPFVWYDLLHVAEVLSRIPTACSDPRFADMLRLIRSKAGPDGRYTPETVWTAWKDWDFGQKKEPSAWMDALVDRIFVRAESTE